MRLQDLKDAIDFYEEEGAWSDQDTRFVQVARRVAALYETCPACKGTGERGEHPDEVRCRFCGGVGMVASGELVRMMDWSPDNPMYPARLARFLFGEG